MKSRYTHLRVPAKLSLFLISYLPLFFMLIIRHLFSHTRDILWPESFANKFFVFIKFYGAVTIILGASALGVVGMFVLLKHIKRRSASSGESVTVVDVENRNSESISYLFTYIIPFMFHDLNDPVNIISVLVLMSVTYVIYTNSTMLLINPTLNIWYSLYQIRFTYKGIEKDGKGLILIKDNITEEGDELRILSLGPKLYYAAKKGGGNGNARGDQGDI